MALALSAFSWLFSLICEPGRDRLEGESFAQKRESIGSADVDSSSLALTPSPSSPPAILLRNPRATDRNIFEDDSGSSPRGVALVSARRCCRIRRTPSQMKHGRRSMRRQSVRKSPTLPGTPEAPPSTVPSPPSCSRDWFSSDHVEKPP